MTMSPLKALYSDAVVRPDNVAFVYQEEGWTYRRFTREVNRLARGLLARGLTRGDRVALHMRNIPELAIAYFACFRIGAIAAPLNTRLKTPEIERVLKRLRPLIYIGQDELYRSVVADVDHAVLAEGVRYVVGMPSSSYSWLELLAESSDDLPVQEPPIETIAALLATSGTTGECKFVAHTLGTISATVQMFGSNALGADDIVVMPLPMSHASGFFAFLSALWLGARTIFLEQFEANATLDAIEQHRGTWFGGSPFMLAEMLESQMRIVRDVTSLKTCLAVGDVCALRVQRQFETHFGIPLLSLWAASEAIGSLAIGSTAEPVSRAVRGADVRLCSENGKPVPSGETGELQVRGANVAIGYWESPATIKSAVQAGWYRTGDLMREDKNGELRFVSRVKDMIVRGGSNISPAEVERAITSHPAVKDVAVVGVPDDLFGQRVAGVVELVRSAHETPTQDILGHARGLIAGYKLPERLEIVSRVPRNSLGKIDRAELLRILLSRRAAVA